jgi:Uma2 family endonuclease
MAVSRARTTTEADKAAQAPEPVVRRALPARHLCTVDEYYRLSELGLLAPDRRTELIDGEIFDMPSIGPGHAGTVEGLGDLLRDRLGSRAFVRSQNPVHLGLRAEPQPDIAVVRRRDDYYRSGHPTPDDVFLVVEVADSTLTFDRKTKVPLYARAGIREYWIVDLIHAEIMVHRDPERSRYRSMRAFKHGEVIAPLAFPDVSIAVTDVLG